MSVAVMDSSVENVSYERMERRPQPPMNHCVRRHLMNTPVIVNRLMLHEVQSELRRLFGDDFEILYDAATTKDNARPAWHVYRVKVRAGVPSEDSLVLEFSCQHDMNRGWSPDNAKEPGRWIIEYFKSVDKANLPGTPEQINRQQVQQIIDHNRKVDEAKDRQKAEVMAEVATDLHTYVRKDKNGLAKRLARKFRRSQGTGG